MDKQKMNGDFQKEAIADALKEFEGAIDHFLQLLAVVQKNARGVAWLTEVERLCEGVRAMLHKESRYAFCLGKWAYLTQNQHTCPYPNKLLAGCLYEAYQAGYSGKQDMAEAGQAKDDAKAGCSPKNSGGDR